MTAWHGPVDTEAQRATDILRTQAVASSAECAVIAHLLLQHLAVINYLLILVMNNKIYINRDLSD